MDPLRMVVRRIENGYLVSFDLPQDLGVPAGEVYCATPNDAVEAVTGAMEAWREDALEDLDARAEAEAEAEQDRSVQ